MRRLSALAVILAVACAAQVASATPSSNDGDPYRWPGARELPRRSQSEGWPWNGRLEHGVKVLQSPYVDYVGEYAEDGHFWGTWELVQLVERAAWRVHTREPGARLSIGELSKRRGGPIASHHSHESGRDVDIAFFMLDGRGEPYEPYAFAAFDGNGKARPPNEGMTFDDARNWELVAKLVADGDARVQYIFVHDAIKQRLLRYGRRHGASQVLLERAEQVMVQPRGGNPHRDHFHVRIYCSPGDRPACKDRPPFHAWYPGRPPPLARMR